jgi:hypothetical protein
MPGNRRHDHTYAAAHEELMRRLADGGVSYLDEHERGEEVTRIVRELEEQFPVLNARNARRLVDEGILRPPSASDAAFDASAA